MSKVLAFLATMAIGIVVVANGAALAASVSPTLAAVVVACGLASVARILVVIA